MEIYDPYTGMWSLGADIPQVKSQPVAFELNGNFYTIGGETNPSDPVIFADQIFNNPQPQATTIIMTLKRLIKPSKLIKNHITHQIKNILI